MLKPLEEKKKYILFMSLKQIYIYLYILLIIIQRKKMFCTLIVCHKLFCKFCKGSDIILIKASLGRILCSPSANRICGKIIEPLTTEEADLCILWFV